MPADLVADPVARDTIHQRRWQGEILNPNPFPVRPVLFPKIAEAAQGWQQNPLRPLRVGGGSVSMSVSEPTSTSYSASEILNRAR